MQLPSNRSFGSLFLVVFGFFGLSSYLRSGDWWPVLAGLAVLTALVTLLAPGVLTPLNRAWMKLGDLMGRVVNPIVLGILFYGVITPFGVARQLFGADPMKRKFEPALKTYWVDRDPPGPAADSFPNQF
jgi:Saxitoxin biosynthesis operon protein SxtJ